MAKVCSICGDQIKFSSPKYRIKDGILCKECAMKIINKNTIAGNYFLSHQDKATCKQFIEDGTNFSKEELKSINNKYDRYKKETKNSIQEEKLSVIKKQFEDAGVTDLFGTKKEVRHLPEILRSEEIVKYATSGVSEGHTYLIVLTNKRLFFVNNNWTWGSDFKEFSFRNINSVTYSTGALLAKVAITNGADTTVIDSISKITAPILVDKIHTVMDEVDAKKDNSFHTSPAHSLSDLRELKSLLDDGIITQEEFKAKKKEILGI